MLQNANAMSDDDYNNHIVPVQVWREYDEGINGKPSLKSMEKETKGKWRTQHHR